MASNNQLIVHGPATGQRPHDILMTKWNSELNFSTSFLHSSRNVRNVIRLLCFFWKLWNHITRKRWCRLLAPVPAGRPLSFGPGGQYNRLGSGACFTFLAPIRHGLDYVCRVKRVIFDSGQQRAYIKYWIRSAMVWRNWAPKRLVAVAEWDYEPNGFLGGIAFLFLILAGNLFRYYAMYMRESVVIIVDEMEGKKRDSNCELH